MIDLASPSAIRKIMDKHGFRTRKSLGQNFLADANIVDKIVSSAQLRREDVVVEIGPGLGVLTKAAASRVKKVIALEIDRGLGPLLEDTLQGLENVDIVYQDALEVDMDCLVRDRAEHADSYKLIANLPYYITTPLIMHLLENSFDLDLIIIMVQQEVAQRIAALPGGKEYGALSVAVQYYTETSYLFKVPGTVFMPRPEVESAVICLKKRPKPAVEVPDEALFFQVVRGAFGQRRKTLLNALGTSLGLPREEIGHLLSLAGIAPGRRGETLSLDEFAAIAREIFIFNQKKG